jgi:hypothetical protein
MDNRPNLYILSDNMIAYAALKGFNAQSCDIESEDVYRLINMNNYVYSQFISGLSLEKLNISLTTSYSVFYRFKLKNSPFEFKWEIFIDEDEENGFYCALHIYNDSIKEKSIHGNVNSIMGVIANILFEPNNSFSESEYATPFYEEKYA